MKDWMEMMVRAPDGNSCPFSTPEQGIPLDAGKPWAGGHSDLLEYVPPDVIPGGTPLSWPLDDDLFPRVEQITPPAEAAIGVWTPKALKREIPITQEPKQRMFGANEVPNVPSPDISGGLGNRKEKRDLVSLEQFVIRCLYLMVYGEQLYEFVPPCWRVLNQRRCTIRLRELLSPHDLTKALTQQDYREVYQLLLHNPSIQKEGYLEPPTHCLNLLDGTLDLTTKQLYQHDPEDGFFHYLDMEFNELYSTENGTVFESFAAQISNGDPLVRQQLLELVSLAIIGCEIKHFYVLLGPSNTGKTQFGRFLEELLGRDNVESVSGVHDFANRFTTSSLVDKRLGTCLDLPDAPLPTTAVGIIKQFVGDDPIKVEKKYQDSKTVYRKPLLLFAGNYPIRLPNMAQEEALLNRMVVIPFSNPVCVQEMQQQLYKSLLNEAPYVVACAIEAYRDLLQNNFIVTRAAIPNEYAPQDSRQEFHDVAFFLERCCEYDASGEEATDCLYQAYVDFAQKEHLSILAKPVFGRLLSELVARKIESVQPVKRAGPTQQRGYRGIKLSATVRPSN